MAYRPAYSHRQFLPIFGGGTNYGFTRQSGSTNYFSTPDSAALLAYRSNFTMTMCLESSSWIGGGFRWLFSYGLIAASNTMNLALMDDGTLSFSATTNGIAETITATSMAVFFPDNQPGYIRLTRKSTGEFKFYESLDGVTWSDITAVTSGVSGNLYNTTQPFILGGYSGESTDSFIGNIYYMNANPNYDNGSATPTLNFTPSTYQSGSTFIGLVSGETWTISGSAQIRRRSKISL